MGPVAKERAKRLAQVLTMSMSLPADLPPSQAVPEQVNRKRDRAQGDSFLEYDGDIRYTGRSLALPSQQAIADAAARYVKDHVTFADISPEYESMQAVPGGQTAAAALIANLRLALQNNRPTAASIAWMLRHLAAAAPSLIVGIYGRLVGHLLHTWASATDHASSRVAALGDRVDHGPITEMISRKCAEHMAGEGTDPSVFVRQCIRTLQVEQNKRSVKLTFASSAAAAVSHGQPQSTHVPPLPPGLGLQSSPAPVPPMVGLPNQTYSQRLRRWIRYPRDGLNMVIMSACMLCGKGSVPGSAGHRSDECQATTAERDQWVQQKIPVQ